MYVYDKVNELAQAIKESKEYNDYKKIKDEVYADEQMKQKIDEFEKLRYEVQLLSIQGEKQDEEKMKKLQELYSMLMENTKVKDFFDVQVRFNIMLADINKIIGDSVKDVIM
ncbi:MAG: YlbF family regulator [Lachnospiraceae bacterium]|jgi:cell fate (sporulation/competence/biofilm development) regulator YlbF (YheA/YmcA/DUF963 family)|nr:YlbF family regulator [Lachnospiraceae bacterium]